MVFPGGGAPGGISRNRPGTSRKFDQPDGTRYVTIGWKELEA
jgi:hypothetical protein